MNKLFLGKFFDKICQDFFRGEGLFRKSFSSRKQIIIPKICSLDIVTKCTDKNLHIKVSFRIEVSSLCGTFPPLVEYKLWYQRFCRENQLGPISNRFDMLNFEKFDKNLVQTIKDVKIKNMNSNIIIKESSLKCHDQINVTMVGGL